MSASDESSAIFCTDTPKQVTDPHPNPNPSPHPSPSPNPNPNPSPDPDQVKDKVNKYAFSGGRETVESTLPPTPTPNPPYPYPSS